jgi:hypothetical protein
MDFCEMPTPRLFPRGFWVACVIASAIYADRAWGVMLQEPSASATDTEQAAGAIFRMGLVYERGGRFEEAEAAFAKAIEDGSSETRHAALEALDRVVLKRERADAEIQSKLGEVYESQGRLADAEAAYVKALEKGPPAMRLEALARIRRLVAQRDCVVDKYVNPAFEVVGKAFVYVLLALLLIEVVRRPLNVVGRRRGRHKLAIADFVYAAGPVTVGVTFRGVLEQMHGRMTVHFERRTILRNSTLPALAQSQSAELTEMVGAVSESAVPFVRWAMERLNQPGYQLTGSIECAARRVNVLAKLEQSGRIIGRWHRSFPANEWFTGQRDLAYEILLKLKEHVDEHAP